MLTTHLHLTDDELLSLTHLRRPSAQARALQVMGVPYRTRPDGTLLVGRIAAERALTGPAPAEPQRQAAANGLRWSRTA
jgi:hypothetical protein